MRRLAQRISSIAHILTYPITWVALHNTRRTRIFIYSPKGNILVVKMWLGTGKWGLPGGGIHKNETAKKGASREILEETGIEIKPEKLKYIRDVEDNRLGLKLKYCVLTTHLSGEPINIRFNHEISEIKWLNPSKLNKKNTNPDLLLCLKSLLQ